MRAGDDRLELAKAEPIARVAERLGVAGLRRAGVELTGPCPVCGGRDRFSINTRNNLFNCRVCGKGGDQVALVEHVNGCDFKTALAFLVGEAVAALDPAELARRKERALAEQRKRDAYSAKARARAIEEARAIWARALPGHDMVKAYLAARGLALEVPPTLRFLPDHPYSKSIGGRVHELHRGPCMIAGIQDAAGRVTAVHQTWIDPAPPHGKATIAGGEHPAKLVRGSKKGGAIRLSPMAEAGILVVGEGIETTLSALVSDMIPGATYWAGVDLGNMSGRMAREPGMRWSGKPDLSDTEAFLPPVEALEWLVFLQDGDSNPTMTRAKLEAGLRRAKHRKPELRTSIIAAPSGEDFNDLLKRD